MWIDSRPLASHGVATAGFSLLDILCALAIAGLLATIAVPSYRTQVARAHRAEARLALLTLAAEQEKFYLECHAYASRLGGIGAASCGASALAVPSRTAQGTYVLEITAADATTWTASATTVRGSPQAADVSCRLMQIDGTGNRTARTASGDRNDQECWSR